MIVHLHLKLISILAFLTVTNLSYADTSNKHGFFVEPSVTLETSSSSINYPSPLSDSTGKAEGFGLGLRAGFHASEIFFVGLDARYAFPQYEDSSTHYKAPAVSTNWGPVVGFQMPNIGLRTWATYVAGGDLDPERSGNFDVKFSNPKGLRVGAGFRISIVSLNLEYQELKYDGATLEELGPITIGTAFDSVELKNKSWIASVSFPLEL